MVNAGIIGASGLTGKELIKILLKHNNVRIKYATSRRFAAKRIENLFPEFTGLIEQKFISPADKSIFNDVDIVFLCLPHTDSFGYVKKFFQKGIRIIDLSADFRIKDTRVYKFWYKTKHKYADILKEAVYGLPELLKEKIINAKLVANPGCFATSILLGISPVIDKLNILDIIIDSKTGISGAGATPSFQTQYINVNENVIPYNFGRKHRHIGEIEDLIFNIYNKKIKIIFTPQIISLDRGILSVIYMKLRKWQKLEKVKEIFKNFYKNEPFVRIVDSVNLHQVQNTNFCDISIDGVKEKNILIVITAIDNLVKGASGQAVQNMNIIYGFNEKEGLI